MRTVTAVPLRALVDLAWHSWSERILRPVLFLTREDALVEELRVLARVEGVVAHVLAVVRAWGAALATRLAFLARLVPHAVVVRHVVDRLELFHLVDSIIIKIVLIVANRIALIKVSLRDAAPVLVVVRATSIYIIDRHAVGPRVFRVEGRARGRREGQGFVEVARRRNLTTVFILLALLHSVLNAVDAAFVETAVDHPPIVFASTVLKVLRVVHEVLRKRVGWAGPLILSCSFPAADLFLDAVKLVLRLVLRQNVYSWRRYVLIVGTGVAVRARLPDLHVVLARRRHHVARSVQAVLLVRLLADHGDAFVWRHLAVVARCFEAIEAALV